MLLLLQEPHLTTLFELLEMLACFKPPSPTTEKVQESPEVGPSAPGGSSHTLREVLADGGLSLQSARCEELHLHAENLSRRVWELLMLLPTCPKMLQAFQNISEDTVSRAAPAGAGREERPRPQRCPASCVLRRLKASAGRSC